MNIFKRKCSVIENRVTNQESFALFKYGEGDYSTKFQGRPANMINLYIVSDEEIKEGDWYLGYYNKLAKCYKSEYSKHFVMDDCYERTNVKLCNKIIASTDKSLNLPSIPKEFLKEYCKVGGINEVMVAYTNKCQICGAEQYYDYCHYPNATGCCGGKCNLIPQLNSKNEIILSIAKDIWTKSEVIHLLKQSCKDLWFEDSNSYKDLDNWIKENL